VLADGGNEIMVLTVKPFEVALRLPAKNAGFIQFTPDSKQIVFLTSIELSHPDNHAHVAWWRLADRVRTGFVELPEENCETVALAPDGNALVCVDFDGDLRIIDVHTAQTIFKKRHFGKAYDDFVPRDPFPILPTGSLGAARIEMSPDGRFVAARSLTYGATILYDLRERHVVPLKAGLRGLRAASDFVFIDSDHLMISRWKGPLRPKDFTTLVELPSGQVLSTPELPPLSYGLTRTADPHFVEIRPYGKPLFWAYNYTTREIIPSEQSALDVLGESYVIEPQPDEVGLYDRLKGLQATVRLH
jgi:WD40 repeat protein